MFGIKENQLSAEKMSKISEAYEIVCERCGLHPRPGNNPDVKHICMTWEDVHYIHRPLLLYVSNGIVGIIVTTFCFRLRGYQYFEFQGLRYWYHAGSSASSSSMDPLIFLHGITPGWLAYASLIFKLSVNRPTFLIEIDAIKIKSMNFSMPSPEKFGRIVRQILHRHQYQKASVVGHSFGSITAGWIVRYYPEIVSHITLIDPVSLLLSLPDVAYSFLYRCPNTMVEWIIYLGASTEVTVSYALRRNFYWYRSLLWLEEIPSHIGIVVGVAECDEITHPKAVIEYVKNFKNKRDELATLTHGPISIIEWKSFSHGQILLDSACQSQLVDVIRSHEKLKGE
jgi:pimeloyl-ACP methyl ester carboxylesterase